MHIAEKRIEIRAPVARVFDLFSDFQSFPRWMENIREVRRTGRRFTRWTAEAPLGTEVEWEAEIIGYEPERRIAWRSVRGDIDTEGEVFFEEMRRGTTLLHVVLGYALPAGRLGEMVARLFGRDPERQLADDLERFAAVVETRSHPSAGRDRRESRGHDIEYRRRPETRAPYAGPPQRRPLEADERRGPRFAPRQTEAARERRERDYYAPPRQRRPAHEEEKELPLHERRARFEDDRELSRRRQSESPHRYAQEEEEQSWREQEGRAGWHPEWAERDYERMMRRPDSAREVNDGRRPHTIDEGARRRASTDERPARDERREAPRLSEADARYEDEDTRPRRTRRHALTPREREREREEHAPDYDYREQAFRRGVEKLMDEPPSRRWRRWD